MKYLLIFILNITALISVFAQQNQNLALNNAAVTLEPSLINRDGEISFDFAALEGINLLPGEKVSITVSPSKQMVLKGQPHSSKGSSSSFTWVEDSFSPGTWTATLTENLKPNSHETFVFDFDVNENKSVQNNSALGFSVDLTPHSKDPSVDKDDNVSNFVDANELSNVLNTVPNDVLTDVNDSALTLNNHVLSPNPLRLGDNLVVNYKGLQTVDIYSTTGQLVKHINVTGTNQTQIETSNLVAGVYLVRINGNKSDKLVID